uniref:Retrotransposon gag domain-containing protein n=1 Tax=Setaria viridis TaxID=4556 RepID=A0A4U6V045_SETVI|nr:hypothetical protein SEVIR_4G096201v2 [Setaria viridis]
MAATLEDLVHKFEGFELMMQQSLDKIGGLEAWQSSTDSSLGTLLTKSDEAAVRLLRLESAPPPVPRQPPPPPSSWVDPFDLNMAPPMVGRSSAPPPERPNGHRGDTTHQDVGGGILGSHPLRPVTGAFPEPSTSHFETPTGNREFGSRNAPLPKLEFPSFHGENPRLWRDRCEMYFEVYAVSPHLKTRFAALNFKGNAAAWLRTFERRGRVLDWEVFCAAVLDHFDRDQYQVQLRRLDTLRQSGSVFEYLAQFEDLSHGILLYNCAYDDTYFVTRFLGGLKEEIRAAIALHRPKDVSSAAALALLQEEELAIYGSRHLSHELAKSSFRPVFGSEKGKVSISDKPGSVKPKKEKVDSDDKVRALMAFRKKNGLCYKCGEKWGQHHKCPPQVPLHVIEELLDALEPSDGCDSCSSDDEQHPDVVMALGDISTAPIVKRKTTRLQGFIGSQEVLILVDSGSIGSFINEELAAKLDCPQQDCSVASFVTTDGTPMHCNRRIQQL